MLIACILLRGSADWSSLPFLLASFLIAFAVYYWRFFVQWLRGIRGKGWAKAPATIDVVTVIDQTWRDEYGEHVVGYLATLTYFYRNPDLQTGDYCRDFLDEAEAQAWATSYKGKTVMVHVDPRDPSQSVLREEEL